MKKILFSMWSYFSAPFSWSKWVDIDTFSFGGDAFLLQAKVNYNSNAKRFRVTPTKQWYKVAGKSSLSMDSLESAGLINKTIKQPLTNG